MTIPPFTPKSDADIIQAMIAEVDRLTRHNRTLRIMVDECVRFVRSGGARVARDES